MWVNHPHLLREHLNGYELRLNNDKKCSLCRLQRLCIYLSFLRYPSKCVAFSSGDRKGAERFRNTLQSREYWMMHRGRGFLAVLQYDSAFAHPYVSVDLSADCKPQTRSDSTFVWIAVSGCGSVFWMRIQIRFQVLKTWSYQRKPLENVLFPFFLIFLIKRTITLLQLKSFQNYANFKDDLNFLGCKMRHSKPQDSDTDPKPVRSAGFRIRIRIWRIGSATVDSA